MKRILLALFLCIFTIQAHSGVQNVYNKLIKATGEKRLPIYIKKGILKKCSIACTDGKQIFISVELLSLVKNDDELAGVIGHEMAHRYFKSELMADLQGLRYAQKAGYGYCIAAQFMKNFAEDKNHPSGEVRYKNSGCP